MSSGYQALQAVVFFAGFPATANAAALWNTQFSEPYSGYQPGSPVSVAQGTDGKFGFEVHHHPNRFDLIIRLASDGPGPPQGVSDLREFASVAIPRVLAMAQGATIVRAAIVTSYLSPARDQAAANQMFASAIANTSIPTEASDLSFQLNTRRASKIQTGLEINRLCRWSTAVGMEMIFHISPTGPVALPSGPQAWVLDFTMDVNTAPETRPDGAQLEALFEELIQEAVDLKKEGLTRLV